MTREEENKQDAEYWLVIAGSYRQERDCARAEIERLRAAIKPFAEAGLSKSARHNDLHGALCHLTMNDLFVARDAYQQSQDATK